MWGRGPNFRIGDERGNFGNTAANVVHSLTNTGADHPVFPGVYDPPHVATV